MNISTTLTMINDIEIPMLGLGLYLSSSGNQARKALQTALDAGYRHFDTAKFYGNEQDVGSAVRESGFSREELFADISAPSAVIFSMAITAGQSG